MSSEPPRGSYEPMRNHSIDPVHEDTNWCQRRMYNTIDQSFPRLQKNSITRDSDILH